MNRNMYLNLLFPCLFVVMALFFFIVGLRGLIGRKPFLISSRWVFALMCLAVAPGILSPFLFWNTRGGDQSGRLSILFWVQPIMSIFLLIFMWFIQRGYLAFAVTDVSFREGLLASLKKLELPHEERVAALHLPSVGADLHVAVQSWIGTGQLKMKQSQFGGLLSDIVKGMNEYFQSSTVPVNLICCIFYVVSGILMVVLAGVFSMPFLWL